MYLQLPSFVSESRSSQKYNTAPEGCPVDWQDLKMILGGVVMIDEDLLKGYYQFHVKQNNYIYPQDMLYELYKYIMFNIVHCAKSMVY